MAEIAAVIEVEDPEFFAVLSSNTRLRILKHLAEPKTVRDLSSELDVPPTRLYYHINLLAEVGAIRVVETKKVGAMTQRTYQAVALSFRPGKGIVDKGYDPATLAKLASAVVLGSATVNAEITLERHFSQLLRGVEPDNAKKGVLLRTLVRLSRGDAEQVAKRLNDLVAEIDKKNDDEGIDYDLTLAFFPADPELM